MSPAGVAPNCVAASGDEAAEDSFVRMLRAIQHQPADVSATLASAVAPPRQDFEWLVDSSLIVPPSCNTIPSLIVPASKTARSVDPPPRECDDSLTCIAAIVFTDQLPQPPISGDSFVCSATIPGDPFGAQRQCPRDSPPTFSNGETASEAAPPLGADSDVSFTYTAAISVTGQLSEPAAFADSLICSATIAGDPSCLQLQRDCDSLLTRRHLEGGPEPAAIDDFFAWVFFEKS